MSLNYNATIRSTSTYSMNKRGIKRYISKSTNAWDAARDANNEYDARIRDDEYEALEAAFWSND